METAYECPKCGVFDWNVANGQPHYCVEYKDRPCVTCGKPTTFVTISAPGYGQGYVCKDNHYDGSQRMLTPEDVR